MKTLLTGLFFVLAGFTVYASGNYDSVVYIKDADSKWPEVEEKLLEAGSQ